MREHITLEKAQQVAEQEVARQRQQPALRGYSFSPVRLKSEEPLFWTFVSGSARLVADGYIPGALYVVVDKRDGHVWSDEEQARYYESLVPPQEERQPARVA